MTVKIIRRKESDWQCNLLVKDLSLVQFGLVFLQLNIVKYP